MSIMWVDFLAATVQAGTPLLLAASGEMMAERSGVLNLGVEGMMLMGAASGFLTTVISGNHWWGVAAALLAGALMASIHAFICISLRGTQVVSGLALVIFGSGLSSFIGKNYVGTPLEHRFTSFPIPGLADLPGIGPILFQQDALVYISFILVPLLYFLLYKTSWGLALRATGDAPASADATGVNVTQMRYLNTILGGALAGLAGAYLSLAFAPAWMDNMTAGRGWIAVALVMFGLWNPLRIMAGAYLFGGIEALTFRLQTIGVTISPLLLQMLPYLMTILVLLIAVRKNQREAEPPTALGLPFDREER